MTPSDVEDLQRVLQGRFPHSDLRVEVSGHRLTIVAGRFALWTPEALDYRALSVAEWAHRVTDALAPKLGDP